MTAVWIASVIVFVVLLFVILLILNSMRLAAGRKVHNDINRMVAVYDRLIERKSFKLEKLKKLHDDMQEKTMFITPAKEESSTEKKELELPYTIINAKYKAENYGKSYRKIKASFSFSKEAIIADARERCQADAYMRVLCSEAERLLNDIAFDSWYSLSQQPSELQREMLCSTLATEHEYSCKEYNGKAKAAENSADGLKLIELYERQEGMEEKRTFDSLDFRQWLIEYTYIYSGRLIIRSGEPEEPVAGKDMINEVNSDICEGYQVIIGNRLFDYSICESEI